MAKQKKDNVSVLEIKEPSLKIINVTIEGTAPLLVHRLSQKLRDQSNIDPHIEAPVKKKRGENIQSPDEAFRECLYWLDKDGNEIATGRDASKHKYWGFPAGGLKQAMISACRQYDNLTMAGMKGTFFVLGSHIRIEGTPQIQQEQGRDGVFVRIGGKGAGTGTPSIRYRAEFPKWKSNISIRYNADVISAESVMNLLQTAGFSVGLGEDRPDKKGGSFGTFTIKM